LIRTDLIPIKVTRNPFCAAICALACSSVLSAAELRPVTLKAWDNYVAAVSARSMARANSESGFLWVAEDAKRLQRVRNGEILTAPPTGHGATGVPGGLIHDWMGAVFIPNTTIPEVLGVLRGYERYMDIYRPVTVDAKLISRAENFHRFSVVLAKQVLFVSTTIAGEYESRYDQVGADRWSNVSYSTRLQDVLDYGRPTERKLEPNNGSGFLWRVYSFARYQERDGGVYMELEALVLTRDVPTVWKWLVNPIVDKISRETMLTSLQQTRAATVRPK
jgi:hypothetical protein